MTKLHRVRREVHRALGDRFSETGLKRRKVRFVALEGILTFAESERASSVRPQQHGI